MNDVLGDSKSEPVRVICGPTGAGKSAAATWFAERHALSVISADSRQLYAGFDIGTAKPSERERAGTPHYGIDVLEPTQRSSAAWWAGNADSWIENACQARRAPVVVGGTGLYLRALFGTLFSEPDLDPERRAALMIELDALSTAELKRWTEQLDAKRMHLGRTQLLRAVEIALLAGRRVSDLHRETATAPRHVARYLVVDPGPVLAQRIADRTRTMLASGWVEEVERLIQVVPDEAPAWNASGYSTIRDMVRGNVSFEHAEERIVIETRQYAKRQRTWFRHQLAGADVVRLSMDQPDWNERATAWWSAD